MKKPSAWDIWDSVLTLCTFVGGALWLGGFPERMSLDGFLTGEEVSSSIRDPLFLNLGIQHNCYATNIAGNAFFWLAMHLGPSNDLFWARTVKSTAMALGPALLYIFSRLTYAMGRPAACVAALTLATIPGYVSQSWVATEIGLDTLWGLAALVVITQRPAKKHRILWSTVAWVMITLSLLSYGGALPFLAAFFATIAGDFWQNLKHPETFHHAQNPQKIMKQKFSGLVEGAVGITASLLVFFALRSLRTEGQRFMQGGGAWDFDPGLLGRALTRFQSLAYDIFTTENHSYYLFSSHPAHYHALGVACALVGVVFSLRLEKSLGPRLLLIALLTTPLAMTAFIGGVPGYRRVIALTVVHALGIGFFIEGWTQGALREIKGYSLPRFLVVLGAALAIRSGVEQWKDVPTVAARLPRDYFYPDDFWVKARSEMATEKPSFVPDPSLLERTDAIRYLSLTSAFQIRQGSDPTPILGRLLTHFRTRDQERYIVCP